MKGQLERMRAQGMSFGCSRPLIFVVDKCYVHVFAGSGFQMFD